MVKAHEELVNTTNETKKLIASIFADPDEISGMSEQNFKLFQNLIKLVDVAGRFETEVAETINDIDRKLNELLAVKES